MVKYFCFDSTWAYFVSSSGKRNEENTTSVQDNIIMS